MSINANPNVSAAPEYLSMASGSGGTVFRQALCSSINTDLGDTSSDDGDQLSTPVTDCANLVHVAYPSILCAALDDKASTRATAEIARSPADSSRLLVSLKQNDTPLFQDFLAAHTTSPSSPLPFSLVSPPLEPAILCNTTLLDTKIDLQNTSLDLYPPSLILPESLVSTSSLSPLKYPSEMPTIAGHSRFDSASSPRKRASSTQLPLSDVRASPKPKLTRSSESDFLPSTLGRSYCSRFPVNHRLRRDFVHAYSLEEELGSGGYGFVMTARHRYNGHEVAVKFIAKHKIPRHGWSVDEDGKDVPKEAVFLAVLDHPGIVEFYDLFEDEVYFYLVQELHGTPWCKKDKLAHGRKSYLKGHAIDRQASSSGGCTEQPMQPENTTPSQNRNSQSSKHAKLEKAVLCRPTFARRASHDLFECIEQSKHKRFSEEDAKYIFAQVVDVIDYLDQFGISHCDIKDENVVIDKDFKIKIIDFGSLVSADPTQPRPFYHRFFGTAAYAPPEILRDQAYQAPPAEIWAIGVLLSFLIMGTSPFPTEDDKMHGHIVLDDAILQTLSAECLHLLRLCLEVNPERRATISEVKNHPWLAGARDRDCTF
ncbi:hypothetical protein EW145_g4033 [Phellinidium pouzarii]|uniref:Protein kinase domain-containing protein n=1 Tax=Phellinidium pouzarii TaxID=167371 RepID=A0A4S4LA33_9AGAM|nr:hypothetical protein EW145_g4033 [Phellinidium pouzarii]